MQAVKVINVLLAGFVILQCLTREASSDLSTKITKLENTLKQIYDKFEIIETEKSRIVTFKSRADKNFIFTKDYSGKRNNILKKQVRDYIRHFLVRRRRKLHEKIRNNMTALRTEVYGRASQAQHGIGKIIREFYAKSNELDRKLNEMFGNAKQSYEEVARKVNKFDIAVTKETVDNMQRRLSQLDTWAKTHNFKMLEKARMDGKSGLKRIKSTKASAYSYLVDNICGEDGLAGINDKRANTTYRLAFGPADFMIHGADFRMNGKGYSLTTGSGLIFPNIINPEMPVDEQITKMRKIFKAFLKQDETIEPYKEFFQTRIAYVKGSWQQGKERNENWFPYCSETGAPDQQCEDESYYPSSIVGDGSNNAEMKYKILTARVNVDLNKLKVINDLNSQKSSDETQANWPHSKCARFTLNYFDETGNMRVSRMNNTYADKIMAEIEIHESATRKRSWHSDETRKKYFRRRYLNKITDQEETPFPDDQVYFTSIDDDDVVGPSREGITARMIYAVPIEVIVLTPLLIWNPYGLRHHSSCEYVNGLGTYEDPYTGICPEKFYQTPLEFFRSDSANDEKDLCKAYDGVFINVTNVGVKCFLSSGTKVVLPDIDGLDSPIRTRYPILPLSSDGLAEMKKLKAMEAVFDYDVSFQTGISSAKFVKEHSHIISISRKKVKSLAIGGSMQVTTIKRKEDKHQHIFTIRKVGKNVLQIMSCDSDKESNEPRTEFCFDKHLPCLTELPV